MSVVARGLGRQGGGEPAQPLTGSSLAPAPRLLGQNMGPVPKDKTHCLQLAGNQQPVCCCFNWKEDLAQGPHISQSSTGESFPLPWRGQYLGWGRARTAVTERRFLFDPYLQELQYESLQTKQQRPKHDLMTLLMTIPSIGVFL